MKGTDKSDISDVVYTRALTWLADNVELVDFSWRNINLEKQSQIAVSELALLVLLHQRTNRFSNQVYLDKCLDMIEHIYQRPNFHEFPFYGEKQSLVGHLIIWLSLKNRDADTIVSPGQFQWLIHKGNILNIERKPYQVLELRYFLDMAGFKHNLPDEYTLYRQTFLAKDFNVIAVSDSDIYSITHTIPYLTDFGFKESPIINQENLQGILEVLNILLGMCIQAKNWDLVAELLISLHCLGFQDSLWIQSGWKALMENQDQTGKIVSQGFSPEQLKILPSEREKDYYIFINCYHPTLMGLIAGLVKKKLRGEEGRIKRWE